VKHVDELRDPALAAPVIRDLGALPAREGRS
jgi:hypothetical protein